MDITPLYELRGRLRAAAISGTELLSEDFRLKRAVEGIKPLEAASPVFAKIGQMARNVLSLECANRPEALLDTITLVDAVLCTQAAVAAGGEMEPVQTANWGSALTNVPYSVLSALVDALTNSGSGRYSFVMETHKEQPELFLDYRVKLAMVQALGASFAELADQVEQWLKEDGPAILPLLQRDFDPKGKKEMVRRVQVMDTVCASSEKEIQDALQQFFRSQLENAEKDVRSALIYALRHSDENIQLLIDMTKTEKGNCRKMAFWALAAMDGEQVSAFFASLVQKKPEEMIPFLENATSEWASGLVTDGLCELLEPFLHNKERKPTDKEAEQIHNYLKALAGKKGPGVAACYRTAIAIGTGLDKPLLGEKKVLWELTNLSGFEWQQKLVFSKAIPVCLQETLYKPHDEELSEFAKAQYQGKESGQEYFGAAVAAHMLTDTPADFCAWMDAQMWKRSLFEKKIRTELVTQLARVCTHIVLDENREYYFRSVWVSPADGQREEYRQYLKQPIEEYLADLMMKCADGKLDTILMKWIPSKDTPFGKKLAAYFLDRARTVSDCRGYLEVLKKLGVQNGKGLAVRYFRIRTKFAFWELRSFIDRMPGTDLDKAEEVREIYMLVKLGQLKCTNGNLVLMEGLIADLKRAGAAQ